MSPSVWSMAGDPPAHAPLDPRKSSWRERRPLQRVADHLRALARKADRLRALEQTERVVDGVCAALHRAGVDWRACYAVGRCDGLGRDRTEHGDAGPLSRRLLHLLSARPTSRRGEAEVGE